MMTAETRIRVRYGEVDRMGYLHHGNYPLYFEVGRTELIRQFGLTYRELEDRGVLLPLRDISIRYHQPALYDDEVIIRTSLINRPSIRMEFEYQMLNTSGELLSEAKTTLVFVNAETRKPMRVPAFFKEIIDSFFPD
jgi:acyl-CoA thioester hydrolase